MYNLEKRKGESWVVEKMRGSYLPSVFKAVKSAAARRKSGNPPAATRAHPASFAHPPMVSRIFLRTRGLLCAEGSSLNKS